MSVKGIFTAIIGTMATIIVTCVVLEMFNAFLAVTELNLVYRTAVRQACVMFTRETYKTGKNGTSNVDGVGVSGTFYFGDPNTVYDELYMGFNTDFKTLFKWGGDLAPVREDFPALDSLLNKFEGKSDTYGEIYADNLVTPANIGVTYLHKDTLNRIFRWNLFSYLMKNGATVGNDKGNKYVIYKGVKIYVNDANISNIEYSMYDLVVAEEKEKFSRLTHIDKITDGTDPNKTGLVIPREEDSYKVVVATVDYTSKMVYCGITPLDKILPYVNKTRVKGIESAAPNPGTSAGANIGTYGNATTYNSSEAKTSGAGSGSIIYYVIK